MADDAPQSLDELVANLATYKEQLNDVDELLTSDPTNAEFLEVKSSLEEVIALTEDLVKEAGGGDGDEAAAGAGAAPPPPPPAAASSAPSAGPSSTACGTTPWSTASTRRTGGSR